MPTCSKRVEEEVERINQRFQTARWKPIVLIERQCNHEEVNRWYRAADLCLVTSLHDGMNLVAKEFVAARDDEDGVLVLSKFTGAAVELRDALMVNPYDIAGVAEAIHRGLDMDRATSAATRMQRDAPPGDGTQHLSLGRQGAGRPARSPPGEPRRCRSVCGADQRSRYRSIPIVNWHRRRGDLNGREAERLEKFFDSVQWAQAPLLLLDYDGTLADFRVDRFKARPWAGVRELLVRIQQDQRTRIIVITGRPAGEIIRCCSLNSC